ncbi:hypothetical protein BTM25_11540 [Actinomadura rubteroloni]|uniref:Uncharacterized protein n=1 Tax=Actinomadura rubteroloni TaxID=1926885 RepID=A0A2P4UNX5_9ACTN|nr:hypothetical protein BTM25_11540 [Actinomadura rubteroloni]
MLVNCTATGLLPSPPGPDGQESTTSFAVLRGLSQSRAGVRVLAEVWELLGLETPTASRWGEAVSLVRGFRRGRGCRA